MQRSWCSRKGSKGSGTGDMVLGPVRSSDSLHHPHNPKGVDGDQGTVDLDPHTDGSLLKTHPPDGAGDVRTRKYDSNLGINP